MWFLDIYDAARPAVRRRSMHRTTRSIGLLLSSIKPTECAAVWFEPEWAGYDGTWHVYD